MTCDRGASSAKPDIPLKDLAVKSILENITRFNEELLDTLPTWPCLIEVVAELSPLMLVKFENFLLRRGVDIEKVWARHYNLQSQAVFIAKFRKGSASFKHSYLERHFHFIFERPTRASSIMFAGQKITDPWESPFAEKITLKMLAPYVQHLKLRGQQCFTVTQAVAAQLLKSVEGITFQHIKDSSVCCAMVMIAYFLCHGQLQSVTLSFSKIPHSLVKIFLLVLSGQIPTDFFKLWSDPMPLPPNPPITDVFNTLPLDIPSHKAETLWMSEDKVFEEVIQSCSHTPLPGSMNFTSVQGISKFVLESLCAEDGEIQNPLIEVLPNWSNLKSLRMGFLYKNSSFASELMTILLTRESQVERLTLIAEGPVASEVIQRLLQVKEKALTAGRSTALFECLEIGTDGFCGNGIGSTDVYMPDANLSLHLPFILFEDFNEFHQYNSSKAFHDTNFHGATHLKIFDVFICKHEHRVLNSYIVCDVALTSIGLRNVIARTSCRHMLSLQETPWTYTSMSLAAIAAKTSLTEIILEGNQLDWKERQNILQIIYGNLHLKVLSIKNPGLHLFDGTQPASLHVDPPRLMNSFLSEFLEALKQHRHLDKLICTGWLVGNDGEGTASWPKFLSEFVDVLGNPTTTIRDLDISENGANIGHLLTAGMEIVAKTEFPIFNKLTMMSSLGRCQQYQFNHVFKQVAREYYVGLDWESFGGMEEFMAQM